MKEAEMKLIAGWINRALENKYNPAVLAEIKAEVAKINERFPVP
jgi:glycine hydroxymethyltransferase